MTFSLLAKSTVANANGRQNADYCARESTCIVRQTRQLPKIRGENLRVGTCHLERLSPCPAASERSAPWTSAYKAVRTFYQGGHVMCLPSRAIRSRPSRADTRRALRPRIEEGERSPPRDDHLGRVSVGRYRLT